MKSRAMAGGGKEAREIKKPLRTGTCPLEMIWQNTYPARNAGILISFRQKQNMIFPIEEKSFQPVPVFPVHPAELVIGDPEYLGCGLLRAPAHIKCTGQKRYVNVLVGLLHILYPIF